MITDVIIVQLEDYDGYFDVLGKGFLSETDAQEYLDNNPGLLVGVRDYQMKYVEIQVNE